ncbi:MAG: dTDP-4-dehydrorhamnose reductase [Sulfitobacter sp. SK025]|nr:MAG: dTDP-4-dehydrorhamnose reductase [Sulfitobacter sp. SK025]
MKVLVFGKTGQVAAELQRQTDVTALGRNDADLGNPTICADIISNTDADVIINAAAFTAVDRAEEEEELATFINGEAPAAMAKAAAARGIPFLHISTDYVFDGSGTHAWATTDEPAPLGAYGRTKLLGEQGVENADGTFAILRTAWVFSAHGENFVKTMLRLGKDRDTLNIVDDQIGGPTPASDIAATLLAMARAFHSGQGASGTYHYAGSPNVSWKEFAREIFAQANIAVKVSGIPTSDYPTPATRPSNSRLDCGSLEETFGIARPDWRLGLKQVLQDVGEI